LAFTVCVTVFCKDRGKHQQSLKYLIYRFGSLGHDITHLQTCHGWGRGLPANFMLCLLLNGNLSFTFCSCYCLWSVCLNLIYNWIM